MTNKLKARNGAGRSRLRRFAVIVGFLAVFAYPAWTFASSVTLPHVFSNNGSITATKLNENFAAVKAAVDDNAAQISALSSPNQITMSGLGASPAGGGTNSWGPGTVLLLASGGETLPASTVSGQPFTAEIRLQTADATQGGDKPGSPIAGGNLVLDLEWVFVVSASLDLRGSSTVSQAATIQVDAGALNNKVVQISGTVPGAPNTPGGFTTTHLQTVVLRVNPATTARGQGPVCMTARITPN